MVTGWAYGIAVLCLLLAGCSPTLPPLEQRAQRYTLVALDRDQHELARVTFGEAFRGGSIVVTDSAGDFRREFDPDVALNLLDLWAGPHLAKPHE